MPEGDELYAGILIESCIWTDPVNSCLSLDWSPNVLEPEVTNTEDDIYWTFNLLTLRSPMIWTSVPLTLIAAFKDAVYASIPLTSPLKPLFKEVLDAVYAIKPFVTPIIEPLNNSNERVDWYNW